MLKRVCLILLGGILLSGCQTAEQVTRSELDSSIGEHDGRPISWVSYCGTESGLHYIHHSHAVGSTMYTVPVAMMTIRAPFPYTSNRKLWRTLKRNHEAWRAVAP